MKLKDELNASLKTAYQICKGKKNNGKYLQISNCIFTMNSWTDKKIILRCFFYDWPLLSSWKISGLSVQQFTFCQKMPNILSYLRKKYFSTKLFTVLHQSKKELLDLDQNWVKTRHLLFKTWKSSISMDSPIVHWR